MRIANDSLAPPSNTYLSVVTYHVSRLKPLIAAPTTRRDSQIRSISFKSDALEALRCTLCCYHQLPLLGSTRTSEKDQYILHPFEQVFPW